MSNQYYSLTNCHFCKSKLNSNYIPFAKLTDYFCRNKKCSSKYNYYTSYDDDKQYYYELGFKYKGYTFRIYLGNEGHSTRTIVYYSNELVKVLETEGELEISGVKDLNKTIKKFEKLLIFK